MGARWMLADIGEALVRRNEDASFFSCALRDQFVRRPSELLLNDRSSVMAVLPEQLGHSARQVLVHLDSHGYSSVASGTRMSE